MHFEICEALPDMWNAVIKVLNEANSCITPTLFLSNIASRPNCSSFKSVAFRLSLFHKKVHFITCPKGTVGSSRWLPSRGDSSTRTGRFVNSDFSNNQWKTKEFPTIFSSTDQSQILNSTKIHDSWLLQLLNGPLVAQESSMFVKPAQLAKGETSRSFLQEYTGNLIKDDSDCNGGWFCNINRSWKVSEPDSWGAPAGFICFRMFAPNNRTQNLNSGWNVMKTWKGLKTKAEQVKWVYEYIRTGKDKPFLDPDPHKIYQCRKQKQGASSEPDKESAETVDFCSSGWGTSLNNMPMFTRLQLN